MIRITLTAKSMSALAEAYGNVSLDYLWRDLLRVEASHDYVDYNKKNAGELFGSEYRKVKKILKLN